MATSESWQRASVTAASAEWTLGGPGQAGARAVLLGLKEKPEPAFRAKRMLDLAVASAGMVLAAPLMLSVAVAIKLESRGPVLFRSRRIGQCGRVFESLKFRTMEEANGGVRLTRVGEWLRRYSLDELPQLWNVLRGEMSVVGSRAPLAGEARVNWLPRVRRFDAMPGMTGLWLLHGRKQPGIGSYESPETLYRKQWSVWLDLKIILRSLRDAIRGTGC